MVKFKKGLLSLVCSLLIMLMIPFSVSALSDDLPAPFIGVNIYQDDVEYTGPYGTYWVYKSGDNYRVELQGVRFNTNIPLWHYDFVLDSNYVGDVTVSYTSGSNTVSSIYYVNGNHLEINIVGQVTEFTISDVHLNDIGGDNTWRFPIESFTIISSAMQTLDITSFTQHYNYFFPFFTVKNGDEMFRTYSIMDREYWMIFMINRNIYNIDQIKNYWTFNNCDVTEYYQLNRMIIDNQYMYVLKLKVVPLSQGQMYITSKSSSDFKYCPIYWGRVDQKYISTDFALQFGLTNDFLDAMVYGTNGTNQSASNLDDSTSDLTQDIGQYTQIENDFNDDMNSHLNNIDTTSTLPTAMGSKFLTSANWVRVQFNRMTDNTPFGSILGFSLVLGLALLIIGKVYK